MALVEAVRPLGLEIRAGLHTGEVETVDGKVGGIAVSVGAAWPPIRGVGIAGGEDLVAGSALRSQTSANES